MEDLLTVNQAAAHLGISAQRIRQFIAEGRLPATRMGWQWLIRTHDLDAMPERKEGWPKGRPRGPRQPRCQG